ncbi:MAG: hypothetical protein WA790_21115 [Sulfitobacter sp.]
MAIPLLVIHVLSGILVHFGVALHAAIAATFERNGIVIHAPLAAVPRLEQD